MATIKSNDPTRTIMLRKRFVQQFRNRFAVIDRTSKQSIVVNDCFGLYKGSTISAIHSKKSMVEPPKTWIKKVTPIPKNEFKFLTDSKKINGFMKWVNEMTDVSIFQVVRYPRVRGGITKNWTNTYIAEAYKRGITSARANIKKDPKLMQKIGVSSDDIKLTSRAIERAFNRPSHAERVEMLYIRTFNDLKGITETMSAQISQELAEGMLLGHHPIVIARNISDRIDKIGIHRATLLARTEVIRAHHQASVLTYKNYGLDNVKVEAEWVAEEDGRVCPLCAPLDGKIFTLDEIEGKIPVHPQCRCGIVPVVVDEEDDFE